MSDETTEITALIERMSEQLERVNAGEAVLCRLSDARCTDLLGWQRPYNGDHLWVDSDGWHWLIFVDAGAWDYIDTAVAPSGEVVTFDDLWEHTHPPRPSKSAEDGIWGVAGYCGEHEMEETA